MIHWIFEIPKGVMYMKTRLILISRKRLLIVVLAVKVIISLTALFIINAMAESPLQGKIIVVDAGHGGVDSGANNRYIKEKDINLDIALRLKKILEDNGAIVYMTRTEDVALSKSEKFDRARYLEDLNARLDIINNSMAHAFVSIHTNIDPKRPAARGPIVLYSSSDIRNRKMAYAIQNILNTYGFIYNGKSYTSSHIPLRGQYYLLVNAKIPGVIVETGFISNGTDLALLQNPKYREYMADSISRGLTEYFKSGSSLLNKIDCLIETRQDEIIDNEAYITVP